MKTEQIIKRLSDALTQDTPFLNIEIMRLRDELKKELLNETTTKAHGRSATTIINRILKESAQAAESNYFNQENKWILNAFTAGDFQVFSSPYRFIASKNHTDHETQHIINIDQRYTNMINELTIYTTADKIHKLPTAQELKTHLKLLKAEQPLKNKHIKYKVLKDVYRVMIDNETIVNLEYLIDAIDFTGATNIIIPGENKYNGLVNADNIAVIMPIKERNKATSNSKKPYDLIINNGMIEIPVFEEWTATAKA